MIALLFDSALLQLIRSTPQPKQQKSPWRQLPSPPDPVAIHSIPQGTRCGPNSPLTRGSYGQSLRQAVKAPKKHCLSSSPSPVHSANTFPADRLCFVCDAHCFAACAVCEQDFCSTHLYACPECDNQYCSRCLDDHRADSHWSDSDTAAELSRGWRNNSASGGFRVGSMNFSPLPTRCNAPVVTNPCVSVRPAPSQGLSDACRSESSQPDTRESKPSHLLSQSEEIPLEVSR